MVKSFPSYKPGSDSIRFSPEYGGFTVLMGILVEGIEFDQTLIGNPSVLKEMIKAFG
jgi:hypothetical protein